MQRLALGVIATQFGLVSAETTHTVAFLPSASDVTHKGLVRVINHSADASEIQIVAFDDAGRETNPITLTVDGRHSVHFTSDDLENSEEGDVLSEGVGSGEGDWRLELTSESDIEVLAYVRTADGFLTAMHDAIPGVENVYEVAIFNPASNSDQVSSLRLINFGELDASVTVSGIDSAGTSAADTVDLTISAGTTRTVTATELERDGLGAGEGNWRLSVESDQPLIVLNLLETSSGYLSNLSSTVDTHWVPLFPTASSHGFRGLVRVLNRAEESGEVSILAFDSTGEAHDPVALTIGAGKTVYFDSDDLEQGNSDKGLPSGTGSGIGDWHLLFESELDIEVLAYLETDDGFFTAIHDTASGTAYRSRVPTFNLASESDQVSTLRLVNVGEFTADVRIQGIDGTGEWSSVVKVSIPAKASRALNSDQLASGDEEIAGMLGEGTGTWQLIVRSDQPLLVLNLLKGEAGQITGLSTVPVDRSESTFMHEQSFKALIEDRFDSSEIFFNSYPWYSNNYELAKYVGFQELLLKYDYRLPTGQGLTILQAETHHTPDDIGDVKHLFIFKESSSHSATVAEILSVLSTYPRLYTRYRTFSHELDSFHTTDTADLRVFNADEDRINPYPIASYDDIPLAPAKLLNISNTNGGSSSEITRQFDKFVEENDIVACTAHSSLIAGNWTTSGMAYNSIVVGAKYGNVYSFDGAKVNDHGSPRYKPDITTRSYVGSATSWASPQACSAAAVLLERAKLDPLLSNAYHSVAVKSILMAGATRFNYRIANEWTNVSSIDPLFMNGEWERTSDELPLSPKYGAGALNVFGAYEILDAGEFDGGSDDDVGLVGWDYARNLVVDDVVKYHLTVEEDAMFSAVLVWHRYIDENWSSYLPDYELALLASDDNRVAFSNSGTSNVELVEVELQPGSYVMEVRVASDGDSPDSLTYGLAWTTKLICNEAEGLRIEAEDVFWSLAWDEPEDSMCHKYRLQVRAGSDESADVEEDIYLDVNAYSYLYPTDRSDRYFRLYVYPHDVGVPLRYPSSDVRMTGDL